METYSKKLTYLSWAGLLLFGLTGMIVGKGIWYFKSYVNKDYVLIDYFQHPFLLTYYMFVG